MLEAVNSCVYLRFIFTTTMSFYQGDKHQSKEESELVKALKRIDTITRQTFFE